MKFKGMLFCTDLDGTLFDSNRKLSDENREAIEYFKSEGGLFTFITGRVRLTADAIYRLIQPNAPFACFNGAALYDGNADEFLWWTEPDPDYRLLVEYVNKELPSVGCHLNTKNGIYFTSVEPSILSIVNNQKLGISHELFKCEDIKEPVIKVVFTTDDMQMMSRLETLLYNHPLSHRFDFIRSEETFFELLPKGVSKGAALVKLAELLNIDIKNTIAAGDYNNDISMVKAAGIGYAVNNAVDELKAVADRITVSNDENAIAKIIYEL